MPLIERRRDQTGETAALHVRIGTVRLCVGRLLSPQPVRLMLETNHPYPLVCGAASKAFLAYLPAASLEDLVSRGEDRASRLKDLGPAIFTQYERTFPMRLTSQPRRRESDPKEDLPM